MALSVSNRRILEEAKDLLGSVLSDCGHIDNVGIKPIQQWKDSLNLLEEILEKENFATHTLILQQKATSWRDCNLGRSLSAELQETHTKDVSPNYAKTKKETKDNLVRLSHVKHNVFRGFQALQQYLTNLRSLLNYPEKQCIPQLILKKRTTNLYNENLDDLPTVIFSYENEPFQGWSRLLYLRQTGKTKGKVDIHYVSPDGNHRFRSKTDLQTYLTTHGDSFLASLKPNSSSFQPSNVLKYFNFSGSFCVCQRPDNVEHYENEASEQEQEEDDDDNGDDDKEGIYLDGEVKRGIKQNPNKMNSNDYGRSKSCYIECSYGRCGCNGWMHPHCVGLGRVASSISQQWPGKLTCPFCSVYLSAACELSSDEVYDSNEEHDRNNHEHGSINFNSAEINISNTGEHCKNTGNNISSKYENDNEKPDNDNNGEEKTTTRDNISTVTLNISKAKKILSFFDKAIVPLWTVTPGHISETIRWQNVSQNDTIINVGNNYWEIEASNYMPRVYGYDRFFAASLTTADFKNNPLSFDISEYDLLQCVPFSAILPEDRKRSFTSHSSRHPKNITLKYESQLFRVPKPLSQRKSNLQHTVDASLLPEDNAKVDKTLKGKEQDAPVEYESVADKLKFGSRNWQIECKYGDGTVFEGDKENEENLTENMWGKRRKLFGDYRQLVRGEIDSNSDVDRNTGQLNKDASEDLWVGITGGFLYLNPAMSSISTTSNIFGALAGNDSENKTVDNVANMVLLKHEKYSSEHSQVNESSKNNTSTTTSGGNNIAVIPSVTSATQISQISQTLKDAGLRSTKALQPSHRAANSMFLKQQQTFFQQAFRRQFESQMNKQNNDDNIRNSNSNESFPDENPDNTYLLPPLLHLWLKDGAVRTVPLPYPPQITQTFPNTSIVYDTEEEEEEDEEDDNDNQFENETETEKVETFQDNDGDVVARMDLDDNDTNTDMPSDVINQYIQLPNVDNDNSHSEDNKTGNDNATSDGKRDQEYENSNDAKANKFDHGDDNANENITMDESIIVSAANNEDNVNKNDNSEYEDDDVATGDLSSVACLLSHLQQQSRHNNHNASNESGKNKSHNKRKRLLYGNYYASRDSDANDDGDQDVCLLRREWLYSDCRRCRRCVLCLNRFHDTGSDTSQVVYVSSSTNEANDKSSKEAKEGVSDAKRLYGMHKHCFWLWTRKASDNHDTVNNRHADGTEADVSIDDKNDVDLEKDANATKLNNQSVTNVETEFNEEVFKVDDTNLCVSCGLRGGMVVSEDKAKRLLRPLPSQSTHPSVAVSSSLWHVPCYHFHHYNDSPSVATHHVTPSTSFTPAVACEVCQGPSRDINSLWRCVARGCTVRAHPLCASLFAPRHTHGAPGLSHDTGWLKQMQVTVAEETNSETQQITKRVLCLLCPQHTLLSLEHTSVNNETESTPAETVKEGEQEVENEEVRHSKRRRRL